MKTISKAVHVKQPVAKGHSAKIDKLGEQYEAEKQEIAAHERLLDGVKEQARAVIAEFGVHEKNSNIVRGDKYEAAVTKVMSSPTLDTDALAKLLTPAQRNLVLIKREVYDFNEAALIAAVEEGKIDRKLVAKCTLPSVEKHERFTLTKLKPVI
jgi:uncharacterized membrane protein